MYVKLSGEMVYLWRAVGHEGDVLDSYITKTRDKTAALAFIKKTLKCHVKVEAIATDGLRSYRMAMTDLGCEGELHLRGIGPLWLAAPCLYLSTVQPEINSRLEQDLE